MLFVEAGWIELVVLERGHSMKKVDKKSSMDTSQKVTRVGMGRNWELRGWLVESGW